MAKKHYDIERHGQADFFDNFHIDYLHDNSILIDNTDGVYHGNILEFKLNISNTGKVLLQAIKYLSRMRIKGESVPARIMLIDLNDTKVYVYHSADYIDDIQKVYVGASSVGNDAFNRNVTPAAIYDYTELVDAAEVQKLLINRAPANWYIPIDLDESCIVGWAERYYREIPNATKGDFLGDGTGKINLNGEIRDPKHFAGLINPYTEPTNEKFKYLMDCLNDRLNKKDLGAFYTPEPYCQKAAELVEMAVARVPDGNDYIILDRASGTGNLESALYGRYDKNGDELISHCVVSTYEYYEYKVLLERIGQDVRTIIPPTEANIVYENGKVSNADAMSKEYIDNPLIKRYVDNPKCTIILYENPPYHDESSGVTGGKVERSGKRKSYAEKEMKKEVKGVATNELANQFIWSGFRYYLRQSTDSYIVFSPIKYWKQYDFCKAKAAKSFLFNRLHFHATASSVSCILWFNEPSDSEYIEADAYDIMDGKVSFIKAVALRKCHCPASRNYSKIAFSDDDISNLWCAKDGAEAVGKKVRVKSYRNDSVIGYLEADSFQIAPHVRNVTIGCLYNGNGCYLIRDQYKNVLPLWVAKMVPLDRWYEKDIYATTADGGNAYAKDNGFLKSCLIYTCLSNQNKCLSFTGSDGRYYRNELCFDATNGDTVASADLAKMTLDADEKALVELWNRILNEAKKTANYNSRLTYGVYQITKELNTVQTVGSGKNKKIVYDYPVLNGYLDTLRAMLKAYYKSHITDKMFRYELLK